MPSPAEFDHLHEACAHQLAIFRAMAPQQRLRLAFQMNRTMRALLGAGFRQRQPGWTETQVQRAVADRILHAATG
jgi:hypothetical protein